MSPETALILLFAFLLIAGCISALVMSDTF